MLEKKYSEKNLVILILDPEDGIGSKRHGKFFFSSNLFLETEEKIKLHFNNINEDYSKGLKGSFARGSSVFLISEIDKISSSDEMKIILDEINDWINKVRKVLPIFYSKPLKITFILNFNNFDLDLKNYKIKKIVNTRELSSGNFRDKQIDLGILIQILENLLYYSLSEQLQGLLDSYIRAMSSQNIYSIFTHLFACLDGFLSSWGDLRGLNNIFSFSEVSNKISTDFQEKIRKSVTDFCTNYIENVDASIRNNKENLKRYNQQLISFIDSNFPPIRSGRKLRRSINSLFKDLIQDKKYESFFIDKKKWKLNFQKLREIRNNVSHGNKIQGSSDEITSHLNVLITLIQELLLHTFQSLSLEEGFFFKINSCLLKKIHIPNDLDAESLYKNIVEHIIYPPLRHLKEKFAFNGNINNNIKDTIPILYILNNKTIPIDKIEYSIGISIYERGFNQELMINPNINYYRVYNEFLSSSDYHEYISSFTNIEHFQIRYTEIDEKIKFVLFRIPFNEITKFGSENKIKFIPEILIIESPNTQSMEFINTLLKKFNIHKPS